MLSVQHQPVGDERNHDQQHKEVGGDKDQAVTQGGGEEQLPADNPQQRHVQGDDAVAEVHLVQDAEEDKHAGGGRGGGHPGHDDDLHLAVGEIAGQHGEAGIAVLAAVFEGEQPEVGHLPDKEEKGQEDHRGVVKLSAGRCPAHQDGDGPGEGSRHHGKGGFALQPGINAVIPNQVEDAQEKADGGGEIEQQQQSAGNAEGGDPQGLLGADAPRGDGAFAGAFHAFVVRPFLVLVEGGGAGGKQEDPGHGEKHGGGDIPGTDDHRRKGGEGYGKGYRKPCQGDQDPEGGGLRMHGGE